MQTWNEGFPAISKQSKAIPLEGEKAFADCLQTQWDSAGSFGKRKKGLGSELRARIMGRSDKSCKVREGK